MSEQVSILGLGKLGLCFALNLERSGYDVIGVDVLPTYVQQINDRSFQSTEPSVNEYLLAAKNFIATTDIQQALESEARLFFVMVATPTGPEGGYDHQQLNQLTDELISYGKQQQTKHLVISCTTMPGYCEILAKKVQPYNYTLSYNPEFIAQGSIIRDQQYPDQVLIGEANPMAGQLIEAVYRKVCRNNPTICRMDLISAEVCKLATNCFLTTKIAFANAIGDLALQSGADAPKILEAIGADSRIGGKYLKYGFGFGGPCLSRDNRALGLFAEQQNFNLRLSKTTDRANQDHLDIQFAQWMKDYGPETVIAFPSITYKEGVDSIEESQQLALAVKLAQAGRKVLIKENQCVIDQVQQLYGDLFEYQLSEAYA